MLDGIESLIARLRGSLSLEDGQTMAEYGLLTVLVALAVVVGVHLLGTNLLPLFNSAVNGL